jgi:MCP family monocarboxylic acid transporter-like MFS transporter 10
MAAGICQQTLCWGMIMTFGTILSFYAKHLMPETSKMLLCLVGGLPAFFVLGMSLLWGRLLDAGHHRMVNGFAMFCLTSGLVGLAFTGGDGEYGDGRYWEVLLASVPIGIGQSAYFLAAPHMAKSWYPKRKGLAMGITNTGAAIGKFYL